MIYLDYAATAPIDEQVSEEMIKYMTFKDGMYANPASRSHKLGWLAEEAIETARTNVASLINASDREIIFTSGATESDNLAIKGAALFYQKKGKHIITSKIEHKAVLDTCRYLESIGFEVTYLDVNQQGEVEIEEFKKAIKKTTILASIMHVNNEIGSVQNIEKLAQICKEKSIIFHVDAAQSIGKIAIDLEKTPIDLLSISGHKIYGPMGIGALYVRKKPRIRLEAQMHGGGHERGMRSGTLATHQIVGLGIACKVAKDRLESDSNKYLEFRKMLLDGIKDIEEVKINGQTKGFYPGILNVSFAYVEGESLLMALKDLAISSGSACTSASLEPSYVLRALGLNDELAHSSLRFSFGRYTTKKDIETTIQMLKTSIKKLREMSPLWEMYKDGIDLETINWQEH